MRTETTVFLVDDDPAALDSLCWLLKAHGLKFRGYSSATEFLNAYDPDEPCCLVLDMRMPGMDGLDLQEKVVSLGDRIPIIFVTGRGDVTSSVRALKAGAIDFLEKPVDHETLLMAIRGALEKDHQRRCWQNNYPDIEDRIQRLTAREAEVMELLYAGETMKRIAAKLGVTVQTVAKHRAKVLSKMEVDGDAELVRLLAGHRL